MIKVIVAASFQWISLRFVATHIGIWYFCNTY